MSDEARHGCPVTPQELRLLASFYSYGPDDPRAAKLRALSEWFSGWLETPALAVERCPPCGHPHRECTCRPDDVYGPEPAATSKPTRAAEMKIKCSSCGGINTFIYAKPQPASLELSDNRDAAFAALGEIYKLCGYTLDGMPEQYDPRLFINAVAQRLSTQPAPPPAQARPLTTRAQVLAAVNRYIVAIWSHETTEHEKAIDELMRDLGIEEVE